MTTFDLPRSIHVAHSQTSIERGTPTSVDRQNIGDTQVFAAVDGTPLPGSTCPPSTQNDGEPGTQTPVRHGHRDTHTHPVDGAQLPDANAVAHTQTATVSGSNFSGSHRACDAQTSSAVAESSSATGHASPDAQTGRVRGGFLRDPIIGVLADVLDDLEKVRIANDNRVRQLTRTETDKDGEERGFGLTVDHPEVAKLILTVAALRAAEDDAVKNLQRAMRKHPLIGFQKRHKGIGEKQLARLLAVLGDPMWNDLHGRPRTVSELWAYTGFHIIKTSGSGHCAADAHSRSAAAGTETHSEGQPEGDTHGRAALGVAPKRTRGQKSNWSETARKRVWVIASAMPKFPGGKYEAVYRAAREKYAEATHSVECVRCGPKGKPAQVGSPLSDGHKHARAVRIVSKEILKDLWIEARDLYASSSPVITPDGEDACPAAGDAAGHAPTSQKNEPHRQPPASATH